MKHVESFDSYLMSKPYWLIYMVNIDKKNQHNIVIIRMVTNNHKFNNKQDFLTLTKTFLSSFKIKVLELGIRLLRIIMVGKIIIFNCVLAKEHDIHCIFRIFGMNGSFGSRKT